MKPLALHYRVNVTKQKMNWKYFDQDYLETKLQNFFSCWSLLVHINLEEFF